MMTLRPSADAYARVAHAHEIQGELDTALATMTMAAEATSPHDPEGQAWTHTQVGHLLFQLGRLDEADREYRRATHVFPDHPYARAGLARLAVARGQYLPALAAYEALMREVPTPEWAAWIGDLQVILGDSRAAEAAYERAERLEREGWENEEPQHAALARFLAERNRHVDEAVRLAERGAASRRDVATLDALAWSYYRAGRLADARRSAEAALQSGTRDRRVLLPCGRHPTRHGRRGRRARAGLTRRRRPHHVRPGECPPRRGPPCESRQRRVTGLGPWVDIRPIAEVYLGRMSTQDTKPDRITLLQGTLDLLILRTVLFGPQHGQGIARAIQQQTADELLVDHGSLYPALQRLESRGWISAAWGTSSNNRRARFYRLTAKGRRQLTSETRQWRRLAAAMSRVLGPEEG